jgi:hypothetical protein
MVVDALTSTPGPLGRSPCPFFANHRARPTTQAGHCHPRPVPITWALLERPTSYACRLGHLHRDKRMIFDSNRPYLGAGTDVLSSAMTNGRHALVGFWSSISGDRYRCKRNEPDDMLNVELAQLSRAQAHRFPHRSRPFRTARCLKGPPTGSGWRNKRLDCFSLACRWLWPFVFWLGGGTRCVRRFGAAGGSCFGDPAARRGGADRRLHSKQLVHRRTGDQAPRPGLAPRSDGWPPLQVDDRAGRSPPFPFVYALWWRGPTRARFVAYVAAWSLIAFYQLIILGHPLFGLQRIIVALFRARALPLAGILARWLCRSRRFAPRSERRP